MTFLRSERRTIESEERVAENESERRFDAEGTELRRRNGATSFFFFLENFPRLASSRVVAKIHRYTTIIHDMVYTPSLAPLVTASGPYTFGSKYASASAHIAGGNLAANSNCGGSPAALAADVPSPRSLAARSWR